MLQNNEPSTAPVDETVGLSWAAAFVRAQPDNFDAMSIGVFRSGKLALFY